jgi:glycosyltransferase involved in cell wall biosynthesis
VVVRPGDAAQLANAIVQLAADRDDREAMGGRARAAAERFSRERQVAAHAQLLHEVAGPR